MDDKKNEEIRYEVVVKRKYRKIPICPTCMQYVGEELVVFEPRQTRQLTITEINQRILKQQYPKLFKIEKG